MSPQAQHRYELLRVLARYEEAYKASLKLALAVSVGGDNVADLNSPLYDVVKMYKEKINKIRSDLRSS